QALSDDRARRAGRFGQERRGVSHRSPRATFAPGFLAIDQALWRQGGHRWRDLVATYVETRIRDTSSESRRRFARRPATARPRGHYDDDHLYARGARTIEAAASAPPSPRMTALGAVAGAPQLARPVRLRTPQCGESQSGT